MNKLQKNINLLEQSIQHWYQNLMILQLNHLSENKNLLLLPDLLEDYSMSYKKCACCGEYFNHPNNCKDCPISLKTENPQCSYTPYSDIVDYKRNTLHHQLQYKKLFKLTSDELNFLINLKEELEKQL